MHTYRANTLVNPKFKISLWRREFFEKNPLRTAGSLYVLYEKNQTDRVPFKPEVNNGLKLAV